MRVDSHQHFWRYSQKEYPWIQPGWEIRHDYLPTNLAPVLREAGLEGCVAVQARQSLEETRWLLEMADSSPLIKGVVGWVDLRSPTVEEQLSRFAQHPKLVGVRHVVQDEPDERFMLREDFQRGIGKLSQFGLAYDILVYPKQLPSAIELARKFPEQRFVLDHLAKPEVRNGTLTPWCDQLSALASCPNVMAKVSGLVTEAHWQKWKPTDFHPYLDVAWNAFGPDRLMYGSDWPVALLSASYPQVHAIVADYFEHRGQETVDKVFGINAERFYDL